MIPTFEQNLDLYRGTLEWHASTDPILDYAYKTYADLNIILRNVQQAAGDKLEGFLTSGTVGNARAQSVYAPDSTTSRNITKSFWIPPYRHVVGAMEFNKVDSSVNQNAQKLFDVTKAQWRKAKAEVIDVMRQQFWTAPTGATDDTNLFGFFYWLSLGTQLSTGGYTGYQSRYNDGSTPGTAVDCANLNSSSTVNPGHASYYADHQGNLDESLYQMVSKANRELNFQPPTALSVAEGKEASAPTYTVFTSANVIDTLNMLNLKLNANVGAQPNSAGYFPNSGPILPGGVPVVWSDILDTANVSLYGTDPVVGINFNMLYPTVLPGWDFALTDDTAPSSHLTARKWIDWCGNTFAEQRKRGGFLISKHPLNS